jgi:hypothetical protein
MSRPRPMLPGEGEAESDFDGLTNWSIRRFQILERPDQEDGGYAAAVKQRDDNKRRHDRRSEPERIADAGCTQPYLGRRSSGM